MAKQEEKQRPVAKKVKDRWRAKGWYTIVAPEMFSSQQLGETIADEPEKLLGRICETTIHDLTGDFSRMHIKLKFSINEVKGATAYTRFIGHELTSDYVRRLTRRKRSKIDASFAIKTKDNFNIQIKPMAVAEKRIQSAQQSQIRDIMFNTLQKNAAAMTLNQFVEKLVNGELSKDIITAVKVVYPLKKIEIRKTEVFETDKKPADQVSEPPKDGELAVALTDGEPGVPTETQITEVMETDAPSDETEKEEVVSEEDAK
jgi:small subunit ribosomal protein S3Ae